VKNQLQNAVQLGELVLAVFDEAEQYSADPREVTRLATQAVTDMLWSAPKLASSPPRRRYRYN
jgi:hypothetical protein